MGERSNDAQEKYSYQGQSLPVLLKFGDLSNKLQVFFFPLPRILMCLHFGILEGCFLILICNYSNQNLKREHEVLCHEVKGIKANSFPETEICDALQSLGM